MKDVLRTGRIRAGAFALALSSALYGAWGLLHPAGSLDLSDPAAFARASLSSLQVIADRALLVAIALLPLALLTLYDRLKPTAAERPAFVALVLLLLAMGPFLAGLGVATFAVPAVGQVVLGGGEGAAETLKNLFGPPLLIAVTVGFVLLTIGSITLAFALWRAGSLPRWAGLMFGLGLAMQILLPALGGQKAYRVVDGLLVGIGGLWLAWSIWRGTQAVNARATDAPARAPA